MESGKPRNRRQQRPVSVVSSISSSFRGTKEPKVLVRNQQSDLSSPFKIRSRPGTVVKSGRSGGVTKFQRGLSNENALNEEDEDDENESDYEYFEDLDITLSRLRPKSLEDRLANLGINVRVTPSEAEAPPRRSSSVNKPPRETKRRGGGVSSSRKVPAAGGGGGGAGTLNNNSARKKLNFGLTDSGDSSDLSERKSARLSSEIDRRISGISSSMQEFDRKVRDVNETLNEAYRKSLQDSLRNRKMLKGEKEDEAHSSGKRSGRADSPDSLEAYLRKSRDNLTKDLLVELGENYKPIRETRTPPPPVMGPGGDHSPSPAVMMNLVGNLSPRKIFGLDASSLLKSSSSGEDSSSAEVKKKGKGVRDDDDDTSSSSSSDDDSLDEGAGAMRISIQQPRTKAQALKRIEENLKMKKGKGQVPNAKPKLLKKKSRAPPEMEREPRSLSPIMPSLPDKQFQSMLERREERVNRHLNSMKNELAQLNQRVELDRRKADSVGGSSSLSPSSRRRVEAPYQGKPMRLMKTQQPDKASTEFNEFIQATGGKAGGWERKDHLAFVKVFDVWRKHPNKLLEVLRKELPQKTTPDIASHIKWYERFEELSSKNRASVHKWSQEKRKENEMVFQMSSASHRAKLESEKRRQEHLRMIREQERDKSKAKLAQWKVNYFPGKGPRFLVRTADDDDDDTKTNENNTNNNDPKQIS